MRERLARDGITRIGELARVGEAELVARYGKIGRRLWMCARGEDEREIVPDRDAKSMSSEITLDQDASKLGQLSPILWKLAETVARRMKNAGVAGEGVTLKLKTADFRVLTRRRRLQHATQSAQQLFKAAESLLAPEIDGRCFRLIGIGAQGLVDANEIVQGDLFVDENPGESKVETVVDVVRQRFGDTAIVRARGLGVDILRIGPAKED